MLPQLLPLHQGRFSISETPIWVTARKFTWTSISSRARPCSSRCGFTRALSSYDASPGLDDFQRLLDARARRCACRAARVAHRAPGLSPPFGDKYEARTYLRGELRFAGSLARLQRCSLAGFPRSRRRSTPGNSRRCGNSMRRGPEPARSRMRPRCSTKAA